MKLACDVKETYQDVLYFLPASNVITQTVLILASYPQISQGKFTFLSLPHTSLCEVSFAFLSRFTLNHSPNLQIDLTVSIWLLPIALPLSASDVQLHLCMVLFFLTLLQYFTKVPILEYLLFLHQDPALALATLG